ncbi:MAG: hydrolase [Clostridia bacterium]|nr:hydrolase [Clostridia bacterium]
MDYKKEFIDLYKETIKREGADKLLEWLQTSDFFTAPASTRFHSAFEGGLCEHSLKSYYRFVQNLDTEYDGDWEDKISPESVAIIALLHDLCKVDYYKTELRNVKKDGVWESVPYYSIEDKLPYGHGEKSVYIISSFMRLTREEAMAINWHMGGFDLRVIGGSYSLSEAFYKHPLSLLFHISDVQATYLDEKK